MYVRTPRSPFSLPRRIYVFLKFLSALWKGRHVQPTNSNRPSYLHPNVTDSVVLHLSDPGGTFHLALHLRPLNDEGSNQDVKLRNEVQAHITTEKFKLVENVCCSFFVQRVFDVAKKFVHNFFECVPCILLNFGHRICEIIVHYQLTNLWSI